MKRFSNSSQELFNSIKMELQDVGEASEIRFQYVEIGQRFTHGFSVSQIASQQDQLILKIWNQALMTSQFKTGIYNLDRLPVTKKVVKLDVDKIGFLDKILEKDMGLVELEGIVLDGLFCQLSITEKKMTWNTDKEMNPDLSEFVKFLREKVGE